MPQEKETYKELQDMHLGQTRILTLTDSTKMQSVATTLTYLKKIGRGEWTHRKDYDACAVSVTRIK